jgi:hypothetical protein
MAMELNRQNLFDLFSFFIVVNSSSFFLSLSIRKGRRGGGAAGPWTSKKNTTSNPSLESRIICTLVPYFLFFFSFFFSFFLLTVLKNRSTPMDDFSIFGRYNITLAVFEKVLKKKVR